MNFYTGFAIPEVTLRNGFVALVDGHRPAKRLFCSLLIRHLLQRS